MIKTDKHRYVLHSIFMLGFSTITSEIAHDWVLALKNNNLISTIITQILLVHLFSLILFIGYLSYIKKYILYRLKMISQGNNNDEFFFEKKILLRISLIMWILYDFTKITKQLICNTNESYCPWLYTRLNYNNQYYIIILIIIKMINIVLVTIFDIDKFVEDTIIYEQIV